MCMKLELIQRIRSKFEGNVKVPHPTLVALGIGIGVSVLTVFALNMMDGMFSVQEAEAWIKKPVPSYR